MNDDDKCASFFVRYTIFICMLCANASLFIVLLVLLVWTTVVVAVHNPKAPKWPDCYSVKAILRLPYAELEEPITAYYEGAKNRSRVDYYGWIFLSFYHTISFVIFYEANIMQYKYNTPLNIM